MSTDQNQLGRLKKVTVREVWANEARDFTPWLAKADNINLLGKTIGLHLEVEAQEQSVGPYRADILCRNLNDATWVLVENQLERTDHNHLGQLLTYAAGLDAVTIVWVAESFTEEHRAALDWLNEKTPEDINFFGLEIELWRIGNSQIAPKFNLACRPNEWTSNVSMARKSNPGLADFCMEYWLEVYKLLEPSGILQPGSTPFRRQDNIYPVGWKNFWLKSYFSVAYKQIGLWVQCRGPEGGRNYGILLEAKEDIEAKFGEEMEWKQEESANRGFFSKIYDGHDPNDRDDWPNQHQLLAGKIKDLYTIVDPLIRPLDNPATAEGPEREPGV